MINVHSSPVEAATLGSFGYNVVLRYRLDPSSHHSLIDLGKSQEFNPYFLADVINAPFKKEFENIRALRSYNIPTLVDYLRKSHTEYLGKRIPEIEQTLQHLLSDNQVHPTLSFLLTNYFKGYKEGLIEHIALEEKKLFPYALSLYEYHLNQKVRPQLIGYSAMEFLSNHTHSELEATKVTSLFETYEPEKTNESPYRVLMEQLNSFSSDLEVHELLEDNVLVAQLLQLESD